jgi:choline-sulfatase
VVAGDDLMLRRLAATALLAIVLFSCNRRETSTAAHVFPNAPVVIISIDTLRADHLPMFGYKGVATPNLDALRRDAVLFSNAYSHVPLTLPSHVSMLTGQLPTEHKVRNNIGYVLDSRVATVPQILKTQGYATGAAVSAYVLRGATGLGRSFDYYEDGITNRGNVAIGQLQRSGRVTADIAGRWISEHRDRPFFFLLHLFEPHSPYEPEPAFRTVATAYDGEIATVDSITGSFLDRLKRDGVYDRAIIIVVSDHGEGLGDHGEPEHGIFVYREAIHVPLLVKLPASERRGESVSSPVALSDLAPTIAALTGTRPPARATGRSLFSERDPQRRIYSESIYPRVHLGWSELRSLVDSRFHYIESPKAELFDIDKDPGERRNVLEDHRRMYAAMRQALNAYQSTVDTPSTIDPEEAKKLAALGYLSSTAPAAAGPLPDPKDRIGEISLMVRAANLVRERKYEQAAAAFQEIVRRNPRLSDGWNQLGGALEAAGRYEEASEVYRSALEATPELAGEFGLRRGSVLLRLEQLDEAERHARLAERTNEGGMHLLLARIELARKNYAKAETETRAAANDPTNRIAAELLLAQIFAQQSRLEEAQALVDRVAGELEREGIGPVETFQYVRGDVLARMEKYDEAIVAFRREIAAFPQHRQPYANLYLVYMLQDRPADARRSLEQMVAANATPGTMRFAARTAEALGDAELAAMWKKRAEMQGRLKPAPALSLR